MVRKRIKRLEETLATLYRAIAAGRSEQYCLKLWSTFVRLRDGRCVACKKKSALAAHHIFRKSLFADSRFSTGNGITLCRSCHEEPHDSFNRKANLQLPMDAEGGEKIELALAFLAYLIDDAKTQQILRDDFYYFSDQALISFKKLQSIDLQLDFPGLRIEQAYSIWDQTPRCMLEAVLKANGFTLPSGHIQKRPDVLIFFDEEKT